MIKSVKFINFRNLDQKRYNLSDKNINVIVGKNNSGKTNILDGIRLAFSSFDGNYVKVSKSDFRNSNDDNPIEIIIELEYDSIPSFNIPMKDGPKRCGFKCEISRTPSGRYAKKVLNLNGTSINRDILENDLKIPNVYIIPLLRVEDVYSPGLVTGMSNFVESEDGYQKIKKDVREKIHKQIENKAEKFRDLCKKFGQKLDIEPSDPRMLDEKLYVVDGEMEHNFKIGSGYKSVANILLHTVNDSKNIILIDEVENHLHPALIRTLIKELSSIENVSILGTTHSPVVINELGVNNIIDVNEGSLGELLEDDQDTVKKLNIFLHPGRNELILADNIVLVEGYSEEIILNKYISDKKLNWTIVNVSGVMFEPYIKLAHLLNKNVIAVSDNDRSSSNSGDDPSPRFNNLKSLCHDKKIKLIEVDNTLETDLYNNNFLKGDVLRQHKKHNNIKVAKSGSKTEIAMSIVQKGIDISNWHVIEELNNELKGN